MIFERFYINSTLLAFETADLGNKEIDLIVLSRYFGLKLSVSFLKLRVLSRFRLAHNCPFLIESFYFTAQDNNLAGEFISK